ncbi:MAG: hypothetical protein RLY35_1780 [Bacteroidota bacterium]
MQKATLTLLILLIIGSTCLAQQWVSIEVKDAQFDNPLAFVFMSDSLRTKGGQTDINGNIQLQLYPGDCIYTQLYGYRNQKHIWNGQNPWILHLESNPMVLNELVVKVKDDPAMRVIAKSLKNAEINNPVNQMDYQFEQYSKMIVDFERTEQNELAKKFENKKLLLSETVSLHQHRAPDQNKETILANQMSGFEFPQSTIIGSQLQSFSAYEADFQIFDRVLISPMGPRAMDRYEYHMLDTSLTGLDSVFVIQFQPKKRFQSNGMSGVIQIKTPEYALVLLSAEPYEKESSYYIKIQQKLEKKQDFFFPSEMNSYYKLTQNTPEIFGEIQTKINHIEIRKFNAKDFDAVEFDFPAAANEVDESSWEKIRYQPLSDEEKNTYIFMDSLGKANHLDAKVNRLTRLFEGQVQLGKLNWDLFHLYRFNRFEGSRLGISLSTNEQFHRHWEIDGLAAYGFKDRQSKWGLGAGWKSTDNRVQFRMGYTDDVQESGCNPMPQDRKNINQQVYEFFITKMDYVKGYNFDVQFPLANSIQLRYIQSHLNKTPHPSFSAISENKTYQLTTNKIFLRWSPGEKRRRIMGKEITLSGYWPIFQLGYTAGSINQVQHFFRQQFELEKTFHSAYWGDIKIKGEWGKNIAALPLNELNALRGSWNNDIKFNISVPTTFETALNNAWYARTYTHFYLRYKWKTPIYQIPQSAPKITAIFNAGWGQLGASDWAPTGVHDYPKGFYETGLAVNDLLISASGGLGIGCYTRLGQYSETSFQKNIVFKIATNFLF